MILDDCRLVEKCIQAALCILEIRIMNWIIACIWSFCESSLILLATLILESLVSGFKYERIKWYNSMNEENMWQVAISKILLMQDSRVASMNHESGKLFGKCQAHLFISTWHQTSMYCFISTFWNHYNH